MKKNEKYKRLKKKTEIKFQKPIKSIKQSRFKRINNSRISIKRKPKYKNDTNY